jgi:hypothetical protein
MGKIQYLVFLKIYYLLLLFFKSAKSSLTTIDWIKWVKTQQLNEYLFLTTVQFCTRVLQLLPNSSY